MKLICSPTSPYARKARILIREKSLANQIEEVTVNPMDDPAELHAVNPLGKIPVLITHEGAPLFDSPVICEYLDNLSQPWLTLSSEERWKQLGQHALGDGLIDAVLALRMEVIRPDEVSWGHWIERQESTIKRTIGMLEAGVDDLPTRFTFGTLAIVCGLGYTDFRAAHLSWRDMAPALAEWFTEFEQRPSYIETWPPAI